MMNLIINFLQSSSDTIYWISATVGTTFLLLRIAMSFFGGGFFEEDVDLETMHDGDGHHDDGLLFKFLTMHSLSGFLMMFGWSGLACINQFDMLPAYACLVALMCGLAMLIIVTFIMRAAMVFEGPGVVFSTEKTVGLVGTVYQQIPVNGQGKIQIVMNNSTRELLAQSSDKKIIESFTLIKVVKAIDHETVEVTKLTEESL